MSKELARNNQAAALEASNTPDQSAEKAPTAPRFVVYGSRISGAYGAANAFEEHLARLSFVDPQVDAVRDAAFIDEAFFNVRPETGVPEIAPTKPEGRMRRIGNLLLSRGATANQDDTPKDVPQGVIVFPEMRAYTPSGAGMFIRSPRDYIQNLCDGNNVPVIFMEDIQTQADLEQSVASFAIEQK